eukprot:scaffold1503_cov250-Pinguiococcus_pyrenoidosus.AAC.8
MASRGFGCACRSCVQIRSDEYGAPSAKDRNDKRSAGRNQRIMVAKRARMGGQGVDAYCAAHLTAIC